MVAGGAGMSANRQQNVDKGVKHLQEGWDGIMGARIVMRGETL